MVRLCPPGFGSTVQPGFDCSVDAYLSWLVGELGKLARPIDLVGHDWGGGHVMRVAMDYPALIRSWATDMLGAFNPDTSGTTWRRSGRRHRSASKRSRRW
ncbi:alpha/beta fold hydrolase [Bradyrhizobium sp. 33ap4]|uniref:alpha/beta fold hydrolase n=1 Tax=Bradyrhizobium sp. 33ap4 TaxID=3061630 RepID=UPI00397741CA